MTTQTEALRLALEALEDISSFQNHTSGDSYDVDKAITAIKEALAQPEQKSQLLFEIDGEMLTASQMMGVELFNFQQATGCDTAAEFLAQPEQEPVAKVSKRYVNNIQWLDQIPEFGTPLYTTPPQPEQKQEYQFGVYSAEDLDKAWKSGYDNCKAQSSWTLEDVKKAWKRGYAQAKKEQRQNLVGIYTTPPQRKPLSDEKMKAIWYSTDSIMGWYSFQEVTKAIEAAHGIKE